MKGCPAILFLLKGSNHSGDFMLKLFTALLLSVAVFSGLNQAQTPAYGNLEIFTREAYLSSFGYFSGSFELPDFYNRDRINFSGINFTHQYDMANLGNVNIDDRTEIRFMLEGILKIGGAIGEKSVVHFEEFYPTNKLKYYLLNLDVFTMSVTPEFTYILDNGYAITVHLGIDLLNIGGSLAILDKGKMDKHTVGIANFIPLTFRPAVFFDFGRSGLGLGAHINTVNILNYRVSMYSLYPEERGFYSFDSFFRKFEFQIIFTF